MSTTTATAETIISVRLTCNHVLSGLDLMGLDLETGGKVPCPKCPARRLSGDRPMRRVKAMVTEPVTIPQAPAFAPEPTDTGVDHGPATLARAFRMFAEAEQGKADETAPAGYDVMAARDEHRQLTEWAQAGEQGDRPATANLDAMNAAHAAGAPKARRTRSGTARKPARMEGLLFCRNGHPLNKHNQVLSSLAWQCTKGLAGDGTGRWNTTELRTWLAGKGIDAPEQGTWSVTLPNGVEIAALTEAQLEARQAD